VDRLLTCAVEVKVAEPSKLHSWHNSGNFVATSITHRYIIGPTVELHLPAPLCPALLRVIEETMKRRGYVREESCSRPVG